MVGIVSTRRHELRLRCLESHLDVRHLFLKHIEHPTCHTARMSTTLSTRYLLEHFDELLHFLDHWHLPLQHDKPNNDPVHKLHLWNFDYLLKNCT